MIDKKLGRYSEAETHYRRSLAILEEKVRSDNPAVIKILTCPLIEGQRDFTSGRIESTAAG